MKDLSNSRRNYEKSELIETDLPADPINLFHRWFCEAEEAKGLEEINAATVCTVDAEGFPHSRVVLLKKYDEEGFVFYTNYNSPKGKDIEENPRVCLSFYWHSMERQVLVKGVAKMVSPEMSDNYFQSRPFGSQLGALVSNQSAVIPNREYLEKKLKALETKMEGKEIRRPAHWGGYVVMPLEVEFWQGRPNRLHDRIRYKLLVDYDWKIERLSP